MPGMAWSMCLPRKRITAQQLHSGCNLQLPKLFIQSQQGSNLIRPGPSRWPTGLTSGCNGALCHALCPLGPSRARMLFTTFPTPRDLSGKASGMHVEPCLALIWKNYACMSCDTWQMALPVPVNWLRAPCAAQITDCQHSGCAWVVAAAPQQQRRRSTSNRSGTALTGGSGPCPTACAVFVSFLL